MIDAKNVQGKKNLFGQFFTPDDLSKKIIDGIDAEDALYIEPSYGEGSFLKLMEQKYNDVLGIELDDELFEKYNTPNTICKNFYDFE
jgi:16S rRNA A1518/A1519 N6-dimethyltransferase RsmA/KsgA/DIM1 with predicted DNA glycosylase/AP lyase activity